MGDWVVYYADGNTFSNLDGAPADAPSAGILCIAQSSQLLGREILHRWPCYYWDGTRWERATFFGIMDRLLAGLTVEAYCEGAMVDTATFRTVWTRAVRDAGLPPKTARDGWESPYSREPDYMADELRRA